MTGPVSLDAPVRARAIERPDAPALLDGDGALSFADLVARIDRVVGLLGDLVGPSTAVAAIGPNESGWIDAYYGVPASGRLLVPLNHRLHGEELVTMLRRASVGLVLGHPDHLARLRDVDDTIVTLDWHAFAAAVDDAVPVNRPPEIDPHDPAWLLFTSGTTAAPKGALLSHASLSASVAAADAARPVDPDDVYVYPFPLCHVAGYNVLQRHANGRPVALLDGFDATRFCDLVEMTGATSCSLAATMLATLLDLLDEEGLRLRQLTTLRSIGYGASPMPTALLRRADEMLGVDLAQGYGMTELSGNAVFLDAAAHRRGLATDPAILTAAGRPAPGVELRIVDDTGRELADGTVGEILVRAPQVMVGYLDDPEATTATIVDGWLHTGDLGRLDDGLLWVVDRRKDMIITGGENVASLEVEEVVAGHPSVARVAVVGVPDARWGENVCAVIVPVDAATFEIDVVEDHVRARLAGFKVPRHWWLVEELPVNAAGKVTKTDLRARLAADPGLAGRRR